MKYYSESITNLIEELASLPNIGPKSAQRLALHILNLPEARVKHLADSILTAKQKICFCKECFNLSDRELCQVCADEKRDHQTIMVVEEPSDLAAYEKTGQYKGVYHVLHGAVKSNGWCAAGELKTQGTAAAPSTGRYQRSYYCDKFHGGRRSNSTLDKQICQAGGD